MNEIVTAIYENGILRPLQPLQLREHQTVRLQLLPQEVDEAEEIIQLMVEAGLMRSRPASGPPPRDPVSDAERQELARIAGQTPGPPLSEIVIEERGEW